MATLGILFKTADPPTAVRRVGAWEDLEKIRGTRGFKLKLATIKIAILATITLSALELARDLGILIP